MNCILIQQVRILDPLNGVDKVGDLFIQDGRFAAPDSLPSDIQRIDGRGLTAVPGLIDLHVHLRDPGQTDKEDVLSGCRRRCYAAVGDAEHKTLRGYARNGAVYPR